ncbi:MAG TPA: hypothetical protein VJ728_10385 [Candidatus Binataceae bacterium]|nr:hypothetical protein [Candidatus Binataceae bacterium]
MHMIESRRAPWRMLTLGGQVWAPFGERGWRPGVITGLGKNRGDKTIVHLSFATGGKGKRTACELYWRKPELKGKDKPKAQLVTGGLLLNSP